MVVLGLKCCLPAWEGSRGGNLHQQSFCVSGTVLAAWTLEAEMHPYFADEEVELNVKRFAQVEELSFEFPLYS